MIQNIPQLIATVNQLFTDEQFVCNPHELYDPIDYTLKLGGKRIRPVMLLAANQLFGGNITTAQHGAIGIEVFHNFTLLHDDLMDKSPIRRGQPTVYRKWDENTAILSGDTMFAMAWGYFLRQPHTMLREILQCFQRTAIEVCEGQQLDMNFETRHDVSIAEYMEMIRLKTAVLLAGALKIGALYANANNDDIEKLYRYGIHLGLAFQLQDDLLDAYGNTSTFGKQTGSDICDNKKTFLYLKALEVSTTAQQERLNALFATTPQDPTNKIAEVIEIYNLNNIKTLTEEAINAEFDLAMEAINSIDADAALKQPLYELTQMLLGREK